MRPLALPPLFVACATLLACPPPGGDATPCNDDSNCMGGQRCVEGICEEAPTGFMDGGPDDRRDAGTSPDAGRGDAGARADAGSPDGDTLDAGALDAGGGDAGGVDAGAPDAGGVDAGATDAGVGPADAGFDAGTGTLPARVLVSAPASVPAGYAVSLTFDHARLVSFHGASPDGADLQLRSLTSLAGTIPYALDPESAWNTAVTTIWFALPDPVEEAGYAAFTLDVRPADDSELGLLDGVFLAGDSFDDGTLSGTLTPSIYLGATITETGGGLVVDMSDDQAEAAVVSATTPIPEDRRFTIRQRLRLDSVLGDDNSYNIKTLAIVQWPQQPGYAPTNVYGENRRQRIIVNQGLMGQSWIYFQDANNDRYSWTENGWQPGYTPWGQLPFATDHVFAIESDGDDFVITIHDTGGDELVRTDPVAWDNVFVREAPDGEDQSTGPFWFYFGEVYVTGEPLPDGGVAGGPYYAADFRSDWLVYRPFVAPEPTVTAIIP